jgi:hypothetical protein
MRTDNGTGGTVTVTNRLLEYTAYKHIVKEKIRRIENIFRPARRDPGGAGRDTVAKRLRNPVSSLGAAPPAREKPPIPAGFDGAGVAGKCTTYPPRVTRV